MSTYTQELAKRIREQNEIRDIYKERQKEAQTSYDTAVNTLKSGGDVYSLDDSARVMYRNIQSELAKQQREEQERLKKEREQMSGIERFGHTLGDFFGQGVGGLGKFLENTVDYFGTMFGADEDWVKRDWTQELFMDKLREGTKGSFLNDGKFGNMVQSSMFGLGNMLPSVLVAPIPYVGGALSTASFMVNAAGGSTENALQNGATRDKALLYGTLSGISEGAIEKISGGIGGVGKGIVQSVGKSAGKSAVAKGVLGTAKKYTGRMIGEGLEEVASDVIDPLLRATYTGKVDYSDVSAGSLAETFGVGAMTSGLMLGGQAMAHNATAANRVRTKLGELNEVKAALDKRYYDGKLTEAQYKQGLSDINWLAEKTIKTMNRVSDRKAEKIVDKVGEKRLENAGIVQSNGKFNVNQANAGVYNYKAMTPSLANKVDSLAYQPTTAELTAEQESLVKDYGKINNGKASIVFTDDIGAVTEDGSKVSANGAYSDGVIYISRTAENPLREVMKHEFTHALEGTKAYGKFANFVIGEIQKSPVLQKEYGDFAKTFIETVEQYKGVTADDRAIVSEIVAKYSERLFSDPKAINRLARANKGLAMKVLGMVTDRLSALGKGKGTAEIRKFLRRAEGLYRKAITAKPSRGIALNGNTANEKDTTADTSENSNTEKTVNIADSSENSTNIEANSQNIDENSNIIQDKHNNDVKFSLAEDSNGVKYVKIDTELDIFENLNIEDYGKKIKEYIKNHFRGVTIEGVTISKISEKEYTMSKSTQTMYKNTPKQYADKMQAATELNNLIKAGEYVRHEEAKHLKSFNKDGYDIYSIIFDVKGNKYIGEMLIAVNGDKKMFYDIVKIKKTSFSLQDEPAGETTHLSNNSIANSETNVNNSATESLKKDEKASNIDENSNKDIKFSLKANKAQLSENITLTAEQIESVDKALKAIANEDIARLHIANAIKSLRIDIDGKTYRVVYNDKYYDVSIDMLTKALEGVKNNSLTVLNTLAKHIINAVELYDENAYKLLKGHSKTEFNKISKLLSHAKRNKIRLSGSLINANDTQIINEYCSVDGAITLTSLVNQLKELGVTVKGRTLINKLQNLDKLYDTVSNSKNGLKLADIAPKKVSTQQRVIANRIIKSIDKTGAMTAIIDSVKNVEKAKAKAVEENAKADAKMAKAKEIEKQSYEREKMEAPIIQIKDICARFKEYAARNYRTGSILAMPDMDGIIKAFNKITWVRGLRSNKSIHEALTLLQSFIKANRNAEDVVLGFSSEIVDKIDELVEVTRLKPYDSKPDKIQTKREVDNLLKVVKAVDYLFKHHHAIVIDGEIIDVAESTETAIKELDYACNFNKGINAISMKESRITSDPRTIYTMVSGAFDDNNVIMRLYDDLLKSETEAKLTAIELLEPVEQFFKDNKRYKKDIYNKKITVHGVSLELGQAIMIYMQSKQVGVIDRLTITGAYGTDSHGKAVDIKSINASDIEAIKKQLSKADFELIKLFEDTFSRAGHVKYEADNNLNGYSDITPGKYYVPLVVEGANLVKSYTSATQWVDEFNERNYGFNQHRNRMATKQLKLVNVFDEVYRHCQDLGVYAKLTQAFRNFDQLMNYNINLGNPNSREEITLKSHIKKNVWSGFDKYQLDFFADIRGDKRQNQSAVIQWLRNNWIVAKLGLNIKSWVSQFSGLAMGVIHLDFKHLAKGVATPMKKERFLEYGGYAKVRVHERAAIRAKGFEGKLGRINSWTTKPIQMADNLMMRQFMSGCESQIEEQLGHKVSTREEMDLVCDLFETTVRETQSGDMISEKSALQRHSSDVLRTLTIFKSDAIKMISNIKKNIYRIIAAKKFLKANPNSERGKLALKEAKKRLRRSVTGMTVSNAIYVGIALLFNLLLRKRDEEGKKWGAEDYGKAFGMGMLESFVGMYPLIGDIFNKATSGYDIEQFSYSMINDLVDGSVGVFQLIESRIKGEEVTKTDCMKALRNVFYAVSEFFGVPSKNLFKYTKMIVGRFDEGAIYKHNSLFYPAKRSELNAAIEEKNDRLTESIFGVMLTERGYGDMSETAQKKLLELYTAVYKDGDSVIPSNVPNKVTWKDGNGAEQEKELKAADKAVYRANNAKAAKDIEKLLKSGVFSSLSKKEQADAVKKIYAYYNALSKAKVTENAEINTQMLLASLLSVEDMAILSVKNASLVADKYANGKIIPNSKKRKLLKLLNSFGLTFAEKELVRVILGYLPSNPKTIKQIIRHSSLNSEEKAHLIGKTD